MSPGMTIAKNDVEEKDMMKQDIDLKKQMEIQSL